MVVQRRPWDGQKKLIEVVVFVGILWAAMEGKMKSSLDWCSIVVYKQKFCSTTKNAALASFATSGPFQSAVRLEGDSGGCSSPRGNWNFNVSKILKGSSIWEQDLDDFGI